MTSLLNHLMNTPSRWLGRAAQWLSPAAPNDAALQPIPIRSDDARPTRRQGGRR